MMSRVMITTPSGFSRVEDMDNIPRIGDTIPLFYQPYPTVIKVIWLPTEIEGELIPKDINVLIVCE